MSALDLGADLVERNPGGEDRNEWGTPRWLVGELHHEFGFTLDACATERNRKLARWCGPGSSIETNGLAYSWQGERVWCNPPFARQSDADPWIEKAYDETHRRLARCTVVMLLPSHRLEQAWWTDVVWPCYSTRCSPGRRAHRARPRVEVRWPKGRIPFDGAGGSPTFGCFFLIWRAGRVTARKVPLT